MTTTFPRTIRLDESDGNVFTRPAESGEWAISGGFEFSNWSDADLMGKARQAFANGWLSLDSFGRATFVAVAKIEPAEVEELTTRLAGHFERVYGAPSPEAARAAAEQEIEHTLSLCDGLDLNTLLAVQRDLTEAGVRESYRTIKPSDAALDQVAIHGSLD
ncbi:MAG: DUF6505 family protein [Pseudomonadota bacterium]